MATESPQTTKTSTRLRNYQRECLDAIKTRYRQGVRRQLICLPTGTGKTAILFLDSLLSSE
jgi:superfamily II DNA or RNA helicase